MHNIGESEMKKKVELHRRIQAYLSYLYLSTTIIARFFFLEWARKALNREGAKRPNRSFQ